ncbi:glycosyltransferase [Vibrio genomosp. F10 str. 9ZC157]|uniref:Glycosyltransferase subfamily 4-like N-terminal domain-containing protein n=1 Tax=Vibrio genomosp. F10 str. ZF-129 TaxID=1187848 RepID=A0A1E5BFC1_9VIBR|nr:glycosyltransferase [Vibrio genomosp. F10]OEE34489.1 hypothetical protein A1QO_07685 [Vibrio genomosp. F10 str. ZF-129]OEE98584.1 hypothetical protein A1QM_00020 [Vibrio genomosp. F10 str. 9ZC157]
MKILYIVHDLNDAAVKRRVSMLAHGGAEVTLIGFYRGKKPESTLCGCPTLSLGETFDASFMQRIIKVVQAITDLKTTLRHTSHFDVIMARNLDMLAIGNKAKSLLNIPLIYECLDIHRFLIAKNWVGRIFRHLEKRLCHSASLLITSSQGFIDNYFEPISNTNLPYYILENKVFSTAPLPHTTQKTFDKEHISIAWNGAIRCHRSLKILSQVTRQLKGKVTVTIWGKPAYTEFSDFDALVNNEPYIEFKGPYCFPDDLAKIYQHADFNWTLDFFEEGGNSEWLLPNRIYEGGLFNVPPIYRANTFMAKILEDLKLGTSIDEDFCQALQSFLTSIDDASYQSLRLNMQAVPSSRWCYDNVQCQSLIQLLSQEASRDNKNDLQGLIRVTK